MHGDQVRDRYSNQRRATAAAIRVSFQDQPQEQRRRHIQFRHQKPRQRPPRKSPREIGWSDRLVIARTSSKSCKAVVAFPRWTAPVMQRRLRWQSTSIAEA